MNHAFDFFDLIYCINLDQRKDRWKQAQKEFESIGILERVNRFSAVVHPDPKEGCRQSHVACVALAKAQGARNVLIFEDDVEFLSTDLSACEKAIQELRALPDWKLFYLGGRLRDEAEPLSENLFTSRLWSTQSYAVNQSVFNVFVESETPIDIWIANHFRAHAVRPLLTTQRSGFSDINKRHLRDERQQRHRAAFEQFYPSASRSERLSKQPILVISPTPTHPQNAGNRCRIFRLLKELQETGLEVHFLYTGNECYADHVRGTPDYAAMEKEWDRFFYVPNRSKPLLTLMSPLILYSFSSPDRSTATPSFLQSRFNLARHPFSLLSAVMSTLNRFFPDEAVDWKNPKAVCSLLLKSLFPGAHMFLKKSYWKWIKGSPLPEPESPDSQFGIDDWYNRGINSFIRSLHKENDYKTVLVEYVFMSAALSCFGNETLKIIDTHDVFSNRSERYQSFGIEDSFFTTPDWAERIGLDRADIVIAIQENEAQEFSGITEAPITTVGHPVAARMPRGRREGRNNLLYIGAANTANIQGVQFFIRDVLPSLLEQVPNLQLLLAGSICDQIEPTKGCVSLGEVSSLSDVYDQADVAINPVLVGTGLKIKNVEALGFAIPLITTAHGSEGMSGFQGAYREANTTEEFVESITEVLADKDEYARLSQRAYDCVKQYNDEIRAKIKLIFNA